MRKLLDYSNYPVREPVDDISTGIIPIVSCEEPRSITQALLAQRTILTPAIPKVDKRQWDVKPRDWWLWLVGLVASVVSIGATWYYYNAHEILLYGDAISHMRIARSAFDNLTPGLAQLGSVWLPLPHMLMWPFIWNDFLWRTGLAGSFESMPCYVLSCILLYLILRHITQNVPASLTGVLIFLVNLNILYLQSTPLSEMLCIVTYSWTIYRLLLWLDDPTLSRLLHLALATFFATLARYDGWFLFAAVWFILVMAHLHRSTPWSQIRADILFFTGIAALGILLWFLWNKLLFGDPLYFQHSLYSSQTQQIPFHRSGHLFSEHSLWQSVRFYAIDATQNIGIGLALAACLGFLFYLATHWSRVQFLFLLALFSPFLFYVLSLYTGQAIIWIPGANPPDAPVYMFNVRYGAQMILPAALFCGILVSWLLRIKWVKYVIPCLCILALMGQTYETHTQGIVTLQDGQYSTSCASSSAILGYLSQHYNGGFIMEDVFTSQLNVAQAQIEFHDVIYEGSYRIWEQALAHPSQYAEWIIVSPTDDRDLIARNLAKEPAFLSSYTLVLSQSNGILLYQRKGTYTLAHQLPLPVYTYPHYPCIH